MRIWLFLFFTLNAELSWSQTTLKVDVRVLEDNRPQQIRVFEPQSSAITIALLVDTTGSMAADLPRVKNAVSRLLDAVKPEDNVGLFTFANGLNRLSNFS